MTAKGSPLPKLQIPSTKLQRNPKLQIPNPKKSGEVRSLFGDWSLKFLWSLVLGAWCLVLGAWWFATPGCLNANRAYL
jgi:hypothetical protein